MEHNQTSSPSVAVVIPCFRVTDTIGGVLEAIPDFVQSIYCVDDGCPDGSGDVVAAAAIPRVRLIRHESNVGVGGATTSGYRAAIEDGMDIIAKIDGDGQMDPNLLWRFVGPIASGHADYTKGNRFHRIEGVMEMPTIRIVGNAFLSFATKLSSGYWHIFDPTNGYTAIHRTVLELLPLDRIAKDYFFESDMLFRLSTVRAAVKDIPMDAVYGEEKSNLRVAAIILPFLVRHSRNFLKRVLYSYFLRDFNIASLELVVGFLLLAIGGAFGITEWIASAAVGTPATAGTVMLAGLPIIVGLQLLLSAINFDIGNRPLDAVHPSLPGQMPPNFGDGPGQS
jgi:dolichol-phosphate mannosyltransferase